MITFQNNIIIPASRLSNEKQEKKKTLINGGNILSNVYQRNREMKGSDFSYQSTFPAFIPPLIRLFSASLLQASRCLLISLSLFLSLSFIFHFVSFFHLFCQLLNPSLSSLPSLLSSAQSKNTLRCGDVHVVMSGHELPAHLHFELPGRHGYSPSVRLSVGLSVCALPFVCLLLCCHRRGLLSE